MEQGNLIDLNNFRFLHGYSKKLEVIFQKFEINKRATDNFKKRLSEKQWLEEKDDSKRLSKCNGIKAAIVELIVADYFEKHGEKIVKLEAWCKDGPDIQSETISTRRNYFTEVKFLGEIPEVYLLCQKSLKSGKSLARPISSFGKIYNYCCMRIVDAIKQLEDRKNTLTAKRVVIVLEKTINQTILRLGEFNKFRNWFDGTEWSELCDVLRVSRIDQEYYRAKTVKEHLGSLDNLVIGFLDQDLNFKINNQLSYEKQRNC